ncbi:MAG: sugar transferase [Bacteroidales bacterium]|nr:sugar transferase [Bacteroidales bacterium]
MKRIFDVVTSLLLFCILSPLFLILSLLILIVDGQAPIFVQRRIGKGGKPFHLFKFRTMRHSLTGKDFDAGNSSRITALGKFLRSTKLDELPQLLNVILGNMSLVGPRPEVKDWTRYYPEKWKVVHQVRPGITDYASLEFRKEEELLGKYDRPDEAYRDIILPQKLMLYIEYVNNRSFGGDLKILLKTIKTVWVK